MYMLISFQEIAWLFTVSLAMTPLIRCIWIWWVWLILFFRWYPPAFGAPLDSIKWLCIWILLEMILLFILGCSGVNIFTNSFLLILGSFPIAWIISASLESASLITISWSSHLNPIFTPPFALPFILPFTPPSTLSWWLNASKFIFGKVILKMSSLFSFRELSLLFNSRKKNAHLPLIWDIREDMSQIKAGGSTSFRSFPFLDDALLRPLILAEPLEHRLAQRPTACLLKIGYSTN